MDIVDKVRRRRRRDMARLARQGLTAESLYEKVAAAFRTPGVGWRLVATGQDWGGGM